MGVPSGHVFRVERARGPVWYATCRLPDGRQVQKKLLPAWPERGRPATGDFDLVFPGVTGDHLDGSALRRRHTGRPRARRVSVSSASMICTTRSAPG